MPLPAGVIALVVVAALVFFGLAHRALDRLRLTDAQALLVIAAIIAGSFVDIPLMRTPFTLSINVGGALIPLGLVVYLLVRADSAAERVRALVGAVITAAAVLAIASVTDFEPGRADFVDPVWLFGGLGGVVGYLVGQRSRRASFVAGSLGLLLTDLVHAVQVARAGQAGTVMIGGAGAFDMIVLAGLLAVGLAEVVGEVRERLSGGPGPAAVALLAAASAAALAGAVLAARAASPGAVPDAAGYVEHAGRYYALVRPDGSVLTYTARRLVPGDAYIDASNRRWEVTGAHGDRIQVRDAGLEPMPQASRALAGPLPLAQRPPAGGRTDVAIYFTHSDESYVPTSGTPAKWWGDIYRVGDALAAGLRQQGVRVEVSRNNHNPHDGQAYTRSRRTALQLMRDRPALLLDVHRDAVPPQVYETRVRGEPVTRVRLVVGRQNQNMQANLAFARQVKAEADRELPGIIEGILVAQGDYNQDLMPRALLLEFGAHTNPLQQAEEGARLFAPVLARIIGPGGPGAGPAVGAGAWRSAGVLVAAFLIGAAGFWALNAGGVGAVRSAIARWWRRAVPLGPGRRGEGGRP
ncbi:MAG TPA: stage II sporulation protein P [Limnochordales bacterium]